MTYTQKRWGEDDGNGKARLKIVQVRSFIWIFSNQIAYRGYSRTLSFCSFLKELYSIVSMEETGEAGISRKSSMKEKGQGTRKPRELAYKEDVEDTEERSSDVEEESFTLDKGFNFNSAVHIKEEDCDWESSDYTQQTVRIKEEDDEDEEEEEEEDYEWDTVSVKGDSEGTPEDFDVPEHEIITCVKQEEEDDFKSEFISQCSYGDEETTGLNSMWNSRHYLQEDPDHEQSNSVESSAKTSEKPSASGQSGGNLQEDDGCFEPSLNETSFQDIAQYYQLQENMKKSGVRPLKWATVQKYLLPMAKMSGMDAIKNLQNIQNANSGNLLPCPVCGKFLKIALI
ncbi:nucleomorphin-like [Erpetoichthys calabaricus]|uniref:nucleomorphin-like n=1 Tax=Erpetoichthys calabaricus TaxID=27687 RepID=UPI002234DE7B|nr:nucleomorphin-like [Erpetoichthys calabaricus]